MPTGRRADPFIGCRFQVEITGLVVAGFSEVTGLQFETEVEEYREGGINDYVHKLPKITRQANITLKRGITDSDDLYQWFVSSAQGNIERKNILIMLMDEQGQAKKRWTLAQAFPVKWVGPDFKADSSIVAIETIELAHNGLVKE